MKPFRLTAFCAAVAALAATTAAARDNIQVAGSSTVLPYASIVAEAFGDNTDLPTPVVESGGSSAGLKRFCEGIGVNTIDVANASRKIKESELKACADNGVTGVIEVRIGYDGIVFASRRSGPAFKNLEPEDLFNALAKHVSVGGKIVENPHARWSDVNPSLPSVDIAAFIPGTKHGTREVFEDKVILAGCKAAGVFEAHLEAAGGDKKAAARKCHEIRTDGRSVDIDGDYTETLARLESNPNGIGVFGLSFFENNTDTLKVATLSGIFPESETISTGVYPASRPLYFYVKAAHIGVIPGLQEYAMFFVSDDLAGDGGPLSEYGLVPDPELAQTQDAVAAGRTM